MTPSRRRGEESVTAIIHPFMSFLPIGEGFSYRHISSVLQPAFDLYCIGLHYGPVALEDLDVLLKHSKLLIAQGLQASSSLINSINLGIFILNLLIFPINLILYDCRDDFVSFTSPQELKLLRKQTYCPWKWRCRPLQQPWLRRK